MGSEKRNIKTRKRGRFSARVWIAAVCAVVNVAIGGGWMIHVARGPRGLAWWQAIPPTAMMALTFAGLVLAIWKNRQPAD